MSLLEGAQPFRFVAEHAPATVVLCHGFTGTPRSMRGWGRYLHEAGFNVLGPRLPGHGTHWQDLNTTRWPDWYGELDRAVDRAFELTDQVFVMGLSMGGTLAIKLAEDRDTELAGMVVVNPSLLTKRFDARFARLMQRVVPSIPGIGSDIEDPQAQELGYDRTPVRAFVSLQALWRVARADLARISLPVLVFHSATDHVVEPDSTALLLRQVSSTDVTEVVLQRGFHVATMDYDKQVIFDGSVDFVTRLLAPSADAPSADAPSADSPGA